MEGKSKLRMVGGIIIKLVISLILMLVLTTILSIPALIYAIVTSDAPLEAVADLSLDDPITGLLSGAASFFGVLLTVLIMTKFNKQAMRAMGWTDFWKSKRELGFGLILGFASITIVFLILWATGQIYFDHFELNFSWSLLLGLITFIFVALNEELFFRGYIISILRPTHSKIVIYIVSAVIFSCAHILNDNVKPLGLINIVLIGLLFAYMFLKTNRLWMPMGYHLTWNFFQGNVWGFQVSGTNTSSIFQPKIHDTILTGGAFGPEAGILTTVIIIAGFFVTKFFLQTEKEGLIKEI
ncbi:type II CAAX endopeptidase family protein [Bacillus sp. FJAT-49736]|uniref:CPBP family intramembrane glutamic endopeptidase n=1 Tax=Bacillus sp. FJAT-49736 TaxID=2833582 RepID=UPI001BCA5298|nr:type II CAAX endopeptidase family protein [Bacillus sp. FJAT-49736]MBS4174818.1 CPBP family intramembrane metalloprotease [Bacillus sp. FJAT-49736]MBS4175525.1 CPBP family intramembrane metalloprotease [Bacillus sp. FJAT-49736]